MAVAAALPVYAGSAADTSQHLRPPHLLHTLIHATAATLLAACRLGLPPRPAALACCLGLPPWPAALACRRGLPPWPAALAAAAPSTPTALVLSCQRFLTQLL
eukprot:365540-Chlamydomonas_euryale.AAC.8